MGLRNWQRQSDRQSQIGHSLEQRPFSFQKLVLDLTTARDFSNPLKVPYPFKGVFMGEATDATAKLYLGLHSAEEIALRNSIPLQLRDSYNHEETVGTAYLTWTAQAGKQVTLYFALEGAFTSGSQISTVAGNVVLGTGSTLSHSLVTVAAATPTLLFAASATRKQGTVVNDTGLNMWIGDATLDDAANKGVLVQPGEKMFWSNAAALYCYFSTGSGTQTLAVMEES